MIIRMAYRRSVGEDVNDVHLQRRRDVSLVVTCAQCREDVPEADRIDDEEECLLRDHLVLRHPNTLQPETRGVLLRHFIVKESAARAP